MEGVVADNPLEPSHITSEGKWAGSLNEFPLDCTLYAAWDLFSDWSHWDRFRSGKIVAELREGENRKPGAVRFHDYPDDGFWITERLLTIDEDEHTLSFNIENHTFLGGAMTGYNGWVKFRETEDKKAMLEYWRYEVNPIQMENQSPEIFHATVMGLYKSFLADLVKAGQKLPEPDAVPTAEATAVPTAKPAC
ncbi:uncharacterized protein [Physcomitrium patens]|uniref:Bet v I/Major latex protein domain-containing protein n=1 Tax=Physcomitrium patens TaxID=3218 RepID=A0A2K1IHX9_PHYPA|nr:uncharacterized protein LOC112275669 isoform X2 [Physcomitrium patens]PNR28882.1 hypothetical protein PHYPA_027574 [Physcomitrium patens]|eukprot:XP_024361992.1 uncharacterized protein LOC112275669 isoform X2 [Physcomitrella patens]